MLVGNHCGPTQEFVWISHSYYMYMYTSIRSQALVHADVVADVLVHCLDCPDATKEVYMLVGDHCGPTWCRF